MSDEARAEAILRKQQEADFHDHHRDGGDDRPNNRFYAIDRGNKRYVEEWFADRVRDATILDYGCGDGATTLWLAEHGAAAAYGIDISPVSINNAQEAAAAKGLEGRTAFRVMDAEEMEFPDSFFDYVVILGVLHHLDLKAAYRDLARVLKPTGEVLAVEGLKHNKLIDVYRRRTPDLRTAWEVEHILGKDDIDAAKEFFEAVSVRSFHFATIAAVPLRNKPYFDRILTALEQVDRGLLALPWLKWQAWMAAFTLSKPRKH